MGMYDHIEVEAPLPNIGISSETFQTKDFEKTFGYYIIAKKGKIFKRYRLLKKYCRYEEVPMQERPYPDDKLKSWMGSIREVDVQHGDISFHGEFNFYDCFCNFIAYFSNGNLIWIEKTRESTERVKNAHIRLQKLYRADTDLVLKKPENYENLRTALKRQIEVAKREYKDADEEEQEIVKDYKPIRMYYNHLFLYAIVSWFKKMKNYFLNIRDFLRLLEEYKKK